MAFVLVLVLVLEPCKIEDEEDQVRM